MSENTGKSLKKRTLNITFIALFAALCYISLALFFFPFARMYIHFGNLLVVAAALLIGGWQGGLAGSVGMGLYDILNGFADSSPKTFLLKFLIGLTVGAVFTFLKNRKKYPLVSLIVSGVISVLISGSLFVRSVIKYGFLGGKSLFLSPIFAGVGIICFLFVILKAKLPVKTAAATAGAICGMLVNIIGETLWKIVQYVLAGSNVKAAVITSLLAQGSTLINAAIAIIGGVALYTALEKPFSKI